MKIKPLAVLIPVIILLAATWFLLSYEIHMARIPWAIGVYDIDERNNTSESVKNPILTKSSLTQKPTYFVAYPLIFKHNGKYLMFYEAGLIDRKDRRGAIALAVSDDGVSYKHHSIVLEDEVSISFPIVYEVGEDKYMTIEGVKANNIRLFKALDFPYSWTCVDTLLTGPWSDPSIYKSGDTYFLFVSTPYVYEDAHIFSSNSFFGPYVEHPMNPVVSKNKRIARNAGNIFEMNNKLYRPVQDCSNMYGEKVRMMEILELSETTYREREIENSPLSFKQDGWNRTKMHTFNIFQINDKMMVATDGAPHNGKLQLRIVKRR